MHYAAYIHREGSQWLAEFPDAPGCQTFAPNLGDLREAAREALEGWIESHLLTGQVPPRPRDRSRAPKGRKLIEVPVSASVAAPLALRWARHEQGLSQADLAERLGVSQQQVAKLERPTGNPTLKSLVKAADALGIELQVTAKRAG